MFTIPHLIALFGGGTAIATVLATLVSNLIQRRAVIAWQRRADGSLATAKQELEKEKLRLETILTQYSGTYAIAQQERINAANAVWVATFKLRETASSAVFFYSILAVHEYDQALQRPTFRAAAYKVDINTLANELNDVLRSTERLRPLIGERLWGLFSVYGSFSGRIAYKLREQADKGHILPWHDDNGIRQFIRILFEPKEQERIDYKTPLGLQNVIWQIELKIVSECTSIISGKAAVTESIEQIQQIRAALETYGINSSREMVRLRTGEP